MNYIYADFNSAAKCLNDPTFDCLDLTGYGTLMSLNNQKIILKEGEKYIFYEPGDIEAEGEVFFDRKIPSLFSKEGSWFAKIKSEDIKETKNSFDYDLLPCIKCGKDMEPTFLIKGRHYKEICPNCGTPITYALSSPNADTSL